MIVWQRLSKAESLRGKLRDKFVFGTGRQTSIRITKVESSAGFLIVTLEGKHFFEMEDSIGTRYSLDLDTLQCFGDVFQHDIEDAIDRVLLETSVSENEINTWHLYMFTI